MDLSRANPTTRFTGLADVYAQSRPDYPSEAIDFLIQRCGLRPGDVIVDVGSGTGIFSRLLAQHGLRVIGIEPNAEMRAKADAVAFTEGPRPHYRDGTGEATSLATGIAAAVACAQAFHWLKADLALPEFHRILRPGGFTALVWNERDERDSFTAAYGDVVRGFPDARSLEAARQRAGQAILRHPQFKDGAVNRFDHAQEMNEVGMIGRAFSASYAPQDAIKRERAAADLHAVFLRFADAGRVTMRYTTSVYTARSLHSPDRS
ncbi:MAG: class I SAM-dependent methyltransferase [Planctomycetes bacterium]|nr:class I SAM-dependent methyltransferase [Planctomycetota bacterium]